MNTNTSIRLVSVNKSHRYQFQHISPSLFATLFTQSEIMDIPVIGWAMKLAKHVFLIRDDLRSTLEVSDRCVERVRVWESVVWCSVGQCSVVYCIVLYCSVCLTFYSPLLSLPHPFSRHITFLFCVFSKFQFLHFLFLSLSLSPSFPSFLPFPFISSFSSLLFPSFPPFQLMDGNSLVLFAEGTRSPDGSLRAWVKYLALNLVWLI